MNFLKNRDAWVQGIIDALPTGSPYTYVRCGSAVASLTRPPCRS